MDESPCRENNGIQDKKRRKKSKKEKSSKKIKHSSEDEITISVKETSADLDEIGITNGKKKKQLKNKKEKILDEKTDTPVVTDMVTRSEIGDDGDFNSRKKKEKKRVKPNTNLIQENKDCDEEISKQTDTDPDEDPEKAAMRKRKREKRHQKKLAKLKLKEELAAKAGTAKASAIDYLTKWDQNRQEWKFMKVRQVWCLQNMFEQDQIDDATFEILLRYLEPLKGNSRQTTVANAEKVIKEAEDNEEDDMESKADRARQIIQLLSD